MASILIVDDEALLARQIARALGSGEHEIRVAGSCAEAIDLATASPPDVALIDLRLPDGSGLEVLSRLRELDDSLRSILMTAYGSVSDAVEAMRRGAADYIQKPLDLDEVQLLVERNLAGRAKDRELAYHRRKESASRQEIIGSDRRIEEFFVQIERLAEADLSPSQRPAILISGETGTGKGMLARAFHDALSDGPFIGANCTAMPETLIEAELFGHERGSFTDAKAARSGLFEAADGGTIFLDEIGHASLEMQAKLLKVLEDKEIRRIGSTRDRNVDVHVIAATNRDLDAAVDAGEFRRDLLHRLRVLHFEVTPLRARRGDIRPLALHFCDEVAGLYRRKLALGDDAIDALEAYDWPGNVRELRNVIERAALVEQHDLVSRETLSRILDPGSSSPASAHAISLPSEGVDLAEVERDLIEQALSAAEGNQTQAAKLVGLSRDALRYRLEKFSIGND